MAVETVCQCDNLDKQYAR